MACQPRSKRRTAPIGTAPDPQARNTMSSPVLDHFHLPCGRGSIRLRGPDAGASRSLAGDPGRPPRAGRRAHRLGQDAGRVPRRDRRAGARRPSTGASPTRRASSTSRRSRRCRTTSSATSRRRCAGIAARARASGPARRGDPHRRAHRRHAAERARGDAPARRRTSSSRRPSRCTSCSTSASGPQDARDRAHRDRRRDPRAGRQQARQRTWRCRSSGSQALCRARADAHRPVGDAEADRRDRALPGRHRATPRPADCTVVDTGHVRAARPGARTAAGAARGGDVERGLGSRSTTGSPSWSQRAPHDAGLRQHAAPGRARRAPSVASGSARTTSPRTTAAWRSEHRLDAEQRLKRGELKALVATASLELGIDIGDVDLVCQIGSPRSIATFLQRVGRSGHAVGGMPKGRLFPLIARRAGANARRCSTRVAARRARPHRACPSSRSTCWRSRSSPRWRCRNGARTSCSRWCGAPTPYRDLTREDFDAVVRMLADGFTTRRGRRGALPAPRRGERRAARAARRAR